MASKPAPSNTLNIFDIAATKPFFGEALYKPLHHPRYFLDDVPAIFKVENTLFKVHRHFLLRGSGVFKTMFSCPPGAKGAEGQSEDKPIVLPSVTIQEFEALLDFFYESVDRSNGLPKSWTELEESPSAGLFGKKISPQTLKDRLMCLLSISTRYDFDEIRGFAIEALESRIGDIDPFERIRLARQNNVDQWLKPAYIQLCQRVRWLDEDEGHALGMGTMVKLARAREEYCKSKAASG